MKKSIKLICVLFPIFVLFLLFIFSDSHSPIVDAENKISDEAKSYIGPESFKYEKPARYPRVTRPELADILNFITNFDDAVTTDLRMNNRIAVLSYSKVFEFFSVGRFINFSCIFIVDKRIELSECYSNGIVVNLSVIKIYLYLSYGIDFVEDLDFFLNYNSIKEVDGTIQTLNKDFSDTPNQKSAKVAQEKSFQFVSESQLLNRPLASIDWLSYYGGFRISTNSTSKIRGASSDYSLGIFTYNPINNSIFIVGNTNANAIAEFKIPWIAKSKLITEFEIAEPIQPFSFFWDTSRVDTGIKERFRVTGLELIGNHLMVNYANWYDANELEINTSLVFSEADSLESSLIKGPYQLQGKTHAAGYISPIPQEWHSLFNASHFTGSQSGLSISGRLSKGPTAFAFNPETDMFSKEYGEVKTLDLLDFTSENPLYDKGIYKQRPNLDFLLYNQDKKNHLWTVNSGVVYGFVIPESRTFLTVGSSAGHKSGLGYKIKQLNGRTCGGPCPYDNADSYSYYWMWDLKDMLDVYRGVKKSYDIRPYDYGVFDIPVEMAQKNISGAAFDYSQNTLYLSFKHADSTNQYTKPPIFLVYKVEKNN